MFRFALLLCYLTATLTGSRPCCCADQPARRTSEGLPAAKPAPAKHSCPLCAAEKKPEPPKPDSSPSPTKPPCPCPKAVAKAPAVLPADDRQTASADAALVDSAPFPVLASAVGVAHPDPPPDPSPHLAALCHRLRC